MQLNNIIIKKN